MLKLLKKRIGKILHLTSTLKMASNNWSHNVPKVKYLNVGETLEGGIITVDLKMSQKKSSTFWNNADSKQERIHRMIYFSKTNSQDQKDVHND